MRIVGFDEIQAAFDLDQSVEMIEAGFAAYSRGEADVPPVGYLGFDAPPGECHIKYGHIRGDPYFVIKVATGFYGNPARGLPATNGFMVLVSAETGRPAVLLDDRGHLTDLRTAIAGLVAAKYLAPKQVRAIGIVGAGVQARMQAGLLRRRYPDAPIVAWGRSDHATRRLLDDLAAAGAAVSRAADLRELCGACNLIVTTTPSTSPLIENDWILPGTHITAVGADAEGKQELDPEILRRADLCAVDSRVQCIDHGESAAAVRLGLIGGDQLVELGEIIQAPHLGRSGDDQVTVADLTGVAVQDIQIAKHILSRLDGPPD